MRYISLLLEVKADDTIDDPAQATVRLPKGRIICCVAESNGAQARIRLECEDKPILPVPGRSGAAESIIAPTDPRTFPIDYPVERDETFTLYGWQE